MTPQEIQTLLGQFLAAFAIGFAVGYILAAFKIAAKSSTLE
ncbi:MAG: hypothetical protein ACU837_10710 [Gammaproteobacteria bacterium]